MRILFDTLLNLIMILVFGALMFFVTREAKAMHCPGCDTTEPSYGSSSFDNRREVSDRFTEITTSGQLLEDILRLHQLVRKSSE